MSWTLISRSALLMLGVAAAVAATQPAFAQKKSSGGTKACYDYPLQETICWHNYSKQMSECKTVTRMVRICPL